MAELKSPFLDGEIVLSASEDDRPLPSSTALETPFRQELALATDRASAPMDEAESFAGEVQFEEPELLQDKQPWDFDSEAVPEFADEISEAEDTEEVDETYEQWSATGADSGEAEDWFEADHVSELESSELSAELAPEEEHLLDEEENDETGAEARVGDLRPGREDTASSFERETSLLTPRFAEERQEQEIHPPAPHRANFTVVLFQKQHFGNNADIFNDIEPDIPFAGSTKDFSFNCPGINPNETALLMFRSRDVDHRRNIFQINERDVTEGLPASPANDAWNGNILLIEPHHQLTAADNKLHVESRNPSGGPDGDIDDFILDNAVIVYKIPDSEWKLPAASGDFAAFLKGELVDSIPEVHGSTNGHNQYVLPTASQLVAWRAVFQNLLAGAWEPAHRLARMISSTYNVVLFLDTPTGRTFYVLMEGVPGQIPPPAEPQPVSGCITDPAVPTRRGWGTYVFAAQPQRALSLSAPHPHADTYTELQAVEAFLQLRAHTLLIAGTDRDENSAKASCSQSSRPFREADVSHIAESVFQIAFEEIYSSDASTWHLQFHGNANCDVDAFLSNGVRVHVPPKLDDLCKNIEHESEAAAAGGSTLEVDVYDHECGDCSLRGTTNMQMRFASGRPHESICHNNPQGPSRFIHIEQRCAARTAPGDDEFTPGQNRGVVLAGISKTFP